MTSKYQDIIEFHEKLQKITGKEQTMWLRSELISEEEAEFSEAVMEERREEQLDALIDLLYVTYGALWTMGIPENNVNRAWQRVHKKNMEKFGPGHKVREDGKLLKPPGWKHPKLGDLV